VDIAVSAGTLKSGSGKCRSEKYRSDNVWKATKTENFKIPGVYANEAVSDGLWTMLMNSDLTMYSRSGREREAFHNIKVAS